MVMQEQARRLSEPLRWGRREKTIVGVVLAIVAVAAVSLIVFAVPHTRPVRKTALTAPIAIPAILRMR